MSRRTRAWVTVAAILLLGCFAAALFALWYRPSRHQSPQQWLKEVRSQPKRETVVGSINVTDILLEPDESYVPKLIAELGWGEDGWLFHLYYEDRRALLAALAACGGTDAAKTLAEVYADMEVEIHVEPRGPFKLPNSNEYYKTYQKQFKNWHWPSVVHEQDTYTAFVGPGLSSAKDVFIGLDLDSDSTCESVYPTGVSDYTVESWHMGVRDVPPKTPLSLELDGDSLVITYNEEIVPTASNNWDWGNRVRTASISLNELTRDADEDGLTDIGEACLHANPNIKDSDGDGMEDAADPSPQVDASGMDYLERGIARAMSFYFLNSMELKSTQHQESDAIELPYQAARLYLAPSLNVAWTTSPNEYGVVEHIDPEADGYSPNPGVFTKEEILSFVPREEESTGKVTAALACRNAFAYVNEQRIAYVLYYYFGYGGDIIVLVDVQGELYPAALINAWGM